ncbi:MAG TPA: isoleucine--tRNA ligase, partial [Candidatus Aenigmarchaeota archaeon]|nr:isoleucine--tRNA ligase [Candidatus Aenigmarchaeota archaeon]
MKERIKKKRKLKKVNWITFNEFCEKYCSPNGIVWERIESIKRKGRTRVADIKVKEFHNFIANGFITHNCETALAYNEIEYKRVTDPAIYVKFRIKGKGNQFLVVFTTTPWTIPSNTGVMVKPSGDYAFVKVKDEILIIAKNLVEDVMNTAGIGEYKIIKTVKGKDLEGLEYEHPLADIFTFQKNLKNAHRVVLSEQFVTLDEGTGLVHTAPGHGQEDYKVGLEYGLPDPSPVNMDGTYTKECGKFSGMYVKEADPLIIEELRKRGLLLHEGRINHEYPHCWRCKSPLLLISVPQWFFRVTAMREKLLEENEKVNWVPKWAGERFKNWLESLGDWPISRQRYWGIPLPIWVCGSCGEITVIGSTKEIEELGGKIPKDLHKPEIDEVKLKCKKCGGVMHRVPDVLDVWFDSGVCSWASLGYPKRKDLFKLWWPADLNIEGPDQIRGWWNSQLITSVITFGKAPFKNILFHGFVLDAHGIKMSKSLGNIIAPEDVISKYGRDVLRFYLLSKPPWDDFYFNMEEVKEVARSFNIIWNTFIFIKTYVTEFEEVRKLEVEDRWILSRLNSLVKEYRKYMKDFQPHKAVQALTDFIINDFSRFYIKLVRDRVWVLYKGEDKKSAFYTLVRVAENVVRLLSPVCPFISERVYQEVLKPLVGGEESVHMLELPKVEIEMINKKLEMHMELLKEISEACLAARQKAKLKLRWPV